MSTILENIDNSVRPGDDFYKYATGKWLENNPQPAEYPTWNVFTKLDDENIKRVSDIITNGSDDSVISRKIHEYYNIIMDYDKRNKEGIDPALQFIIRHVYCPENAVNITNQTYINDTAKYNIELFFNTGLTPDSKGSGKYEVCIYQSGLGLGNRDYYMNNTPENKKIVSAYMNYLMDMFALYTGEESTVKEAFAAIWNVEKKLAEISYTQEQLQDPILNYNKMSVKDLSIQTNFDWHTYLCNLGYTDTETVIVSNLEFLKVACNLFNTLPVKTLQYIYMWNIMNIASNKLSDEIYDLDFKFSQVFNGATTQVPKWKRAVNRINGTFADPIGQIYVKKYFNSESKEAVEEMVHELKDSFSEIITEQTWMSDETKAKALDKLNSMKLKIGYPNKFEDYSDIPISSELSYFDNYMNVRAYFWQKDIKRHYNKDIDLDEWYMWYMSPQTINAYYDCIQNEICFPAAILQYPFFDINRTFVENLGGIGTIIAHEMTHAFDNHGRLYDKNGVLTDWWTQEDSDRFTTLTENTKNHFDNIEVLPGLNCNGSLTLGENIADFGGLKIAYRVLQKHIMKSSHMPIDAYQTTINEWKRLFFLAYANNWAGTTTDETIRTMVINNGHSVNKIRVNGTLPMFDNWYEAYEITEDDALYVNKDKRALIW